MARSILTALLGILLGIFIGIYLPLYKPLSQSANNKAQKQIIGFLPYWQAGKIQINDIKKLTTFAYFGLKINKDGKIIKMSNDQEEDPSWYVLQSGLFKPYFLEAQKNNKDLSLVISSGDPVTIRELLQNPVVHANTLMHEISPVMKEFHFKNLNVDIEFAAKASQRDRNNFTKFITVIKQQLKIKKIGTLTIDISPSDTLKNNLIDLEAVAPEADNIVLMAYDYHSPTSLVTGPVAPLNGAGVNSEFDVTTAVEKTIGVVNPSKLILGIPLYGYEWETLNTAIHSAIIPGTGVLASDNRAESTLLNCATCSAYFDTASQEEFAVYQDPISGTYHQIYFPNQQSVYSKIRFANNKHLGGIALWALGYENNTMLNSLTRYK